MIFSLINVGNNEIYSNIKIQNIEAFGKTQEEINKEIRKIYNEKKKLKVLY